MAYTNPLIQSVLADIAHSQARSSSMAQVQSLLGSLRGGAQPSGGGGYSAPANAPGKGLTSILAPNGQRVTVAANYARQFSGLLSDLWNAGYHYKSVSGYNYRNIAGTHTLSKHATGEAIDIDPGANKGTRLGGGGNPTGYFNPTLVKSIIRKYGLDWGGLWSGSEDPMHFSTGG